MRALDLTFEALGLIAAHWRPLVSVLLPIYAVQWGALHVMQSAIARAIDGIAAQETQAFLAIWGVGLGLILVWSLGAALLAVLWHRLVLSPAVVWPPLGAFGRYLWEAFKLSVLLAVLSWVIIAIVSAVFSMTPIFLFNFFWVFAFVLSMLTTWLWIRFGLVLPAAAVGDTDMTLVTSWFETEDRAVAILTLAAVQGVLWSAINSIDAWSGQSGAELFLWPLPVLFGLAALSALYRDRERDARPQAGADE